MVDDLSDAAETLAAMIRLNGYSVRTAGDGLEALKLVEALQPDCVICDVIMPELNGAELCVRLRERYGDAIVLIGITGFAAGDPRVAHMFAVVDHYFMKPLEPEMLNKVLPPL